MENKNLFILRIDMTGKVIGNEGSFASRPLQTREDAMGLFEGDMAALETALTTHGGRVPYKQLAEYTIRGTQLHAMLMVVDTGMEHLLLGSAEGSPEQLEAADMEAAGVDEVTGIRNRGAFLNEMKRIGNELNKEPFPCALLAIKIKDVEKIYDQHGKDSGDGCVQKVSQLICSLFKHSPIFRAGKDEFAAILWGSDLKNSDDILHKINMNARRIENLNGLNMKMEYRPQSTDESLGDIFFALEGSL